MKGFVQAVKRRMQKEDRQLNSRGSVSSTRSQEGEWDNPILSKASSGPRTSTENTNTHSAASTSSASARPSDSSGVTSPTHHTAGGTTTTSHQYNSDSPTNSGAAASGEHLNSSSSPHSGHISSTPHSAPNNAGDSPTSPSTSVAGSTSSGHTMHRAGTRGDLSLQRREESAGARLNARHPAPVVAGVTDAAASTTSDASLGGKLTGSSTSPKRHTPYHNRGVTEGGPAGAAPRGGATASATGNKSSDSSSRASTGSASTAAAPGSASGAAAARSPTHSGSGLLSTGSGNVDSSGLPERIDGVIFPSHWNPAQREWRGDRLPALRDAAPARKSELVWQKLAVCSVVYDFNKADAFVREKEAKRATLCELVEHVNNTPLYFDEQTLAETIRMVACNIFRSLPQNHGSSTSETEEEDYALDNAWPHLQVVYELFLRVIVSHDTDSRVAKRYIEQTFVLKLLELFHSEDPRERDYLKTVLHRIYGKIMPMRSFIRRAIQLVFHRSVYEKEMQNGIAELLEILGSIVNGFALPLKEEHKTFLEKSLIPLHKGRSLISYHQYLAYCMTQYVEKDNRLAEVVVKGLLRYWPATNTSKEVYFLNELEDILELTQVEGFRAVMEPLFQRLATCIQSPHFQVAERALFLWNSDHIVKMINANRNVLFPIVVGALYKNSREHWNTTVNGLTYNVSKLLAQVDPILFDKCSDRNLAKKDKKEELEKERSRRWDELQKAFEEKQSSLPTPADSVTVRK